MVMATLQVRLTVLVARSWPWGKIEGWETLLRVYYATSLRIVGLHVITVRLLYACANIEIQKLLRTPCWAAPNMSDFQGPEVVAAP